MSYSVVNEFGLAVLGGQKLATRAEAEWVRSEYLDDDLRVVAVEEEELVPDLPAPHRIFAIHPRNAFSLIPDNVEEEDEAAAEASAERAAELEGK